MSETSKDPSSTDAETRVPVEEKSAVNTINLRVAAQVWMCREKT